MSLPAILPVPILADQWRLSTLAMQFRSTRDANRRLEIAGEYAAAVERLIESGLWTEVPPPEDQLPDDYMPGCFFEFWLNDDE